MLDDSQTKAAPSFLPEEAETSRNASVTAMLEWMESLHIDPTAESEVLWIAQEAFNAELPPGWEEKVDGDGASSFHNSTTGESCSHHPMDQLFKEAVGYWRRIHIAGGFWNVEDEMLELERQLQEESANWTEQDAGGTAYLNSKTGETRPDDPRPRMFYDFYTRVQMLGKMKQRAPLLARAPRPEDTSEADKRRRLREEQEMAYRIECATRIQAAARAKAARQRVSRLKVKAVIDKGVQPLKDRGVHMHFEKTASGAEEIVIREDAERRRFAAAQRIQSRWRARRCRNDLAAALEHHRYLFGKAKIIQTHFRTVVAPRRQTQKAEEKRHTAACKIQSLFRFRRDRKLVAYLAEGRKVYQKLYRNAAKIQSLFRMALAIRAVRYKRAHFKDEKVTVIAAKMKSFLAQVQLSHLQHEAEPCDLVLAHNQDEFTRVLAPYSFELIMYPRGKERCPTGGAPHAVDLFHKVPAESASSGREVQACTKIQTWMRIRLARARVKRRREIIDYLGKELLKESHLCMERRKKSAVHIQSHARGMITRRREVMGQKYDSHFQKVAQQVRDAQAYFQRYLAQKWLVKFTSDGSQDDASTRIQARWRGCMARHQVKLMQEEVLWPMKGWFEYTGMSTDAVRVEVQFFANPRFDGYKHFQAHGSHSSSHIEHAPRPHAHSSLSAISEDATEVHKHSKGHHRHHSKGHHHSKKKRADSTEEDATPQSRQGSKDNKVAREDPNAGDSASELQFVKEVMTSEGPKVPVDDVTATSQEAQAPTAAQMNVAQAANAQPTEAQESEAPPTVERISSGRKEQQRGQKDVEPSKLALKRAVSSGSSSSKRPFTPSCILTVVQDGDKFEWSPRRGNISPGVPARAWDSKDRPASQEHPLAMRSSTPLSPHSMSSGTSAKQPLRPISVTQLKEQLEKERKVQSVTPPAPPNALQILQQFETEGGLSSRAQSSYQPKRSSMASREGQQARAKTAKAELDPNINYERKRMVEELMQRQKKHQDKQRKQQLREAKRSGEQVLVAAPDDDLSQAKVKDLKQWLLKKQEAAQAQIEPSPMRKLLRAAHKDTGIPFSKLQEAQNELGSCRRARIADQKKDYLAMRRVPFKLPEDDRVLHRHIHHHVHHHEGIPDHEDALRAYTPPAMMQSASAIDLRSGSADGGNMVGMPWRPLGHSASAGQVQNLGMPLPACMDPYSYQRGLGVRAAYPAQHLEGVTALPSLQNAGSRM